MEKEKKEPRYIRGKYTQAQKEATMRYLVKAYDEIKIRVPKGEKALLQDFAMRHNTSLNSLFTEAVYKLIGEVEHQEAVSSDNITEE